MFRVDVNGVILHININKYQIPGSVPIYRIILKPFLILSCFLVQTDFTREHRKLQQCLQEKYITNLDRQ